MTFSVISVSLKSRTGREFNKFIVLSISKQQLVYATLAFVFQVSNITVLNCNVSCHRVSLKHTLKKKGRAFRNIGKYTSLTVKSALLFFRLFV